jgi:hypothetical protein
LALQRTYTRGFLRSRLGLMVWPITKKEPASMKLFKLPFLEDEGFVLPSR